MAEAAWEKKKKTPDGTPYVPFQYVTKELFFQAMYNCITTNATSKECLMTLITIDYLNNETINYSLST